MAVGASLKNDPTPSFARATGFEGRRYATKSDMAKIRIKIQDRKTKALIPAVINNQLSDAARKEVERFGELSLSRRLLGAVNNLFGSAESFPFNWTRNLYKADYDARSQVWIIECAHAAAKGLPKTQGAMVVYAGASQATQRDVLMVAGIEVAQHNQRMAFGRLRWGGSYRGVGSRLIRQAASQSKRMGFHGRLGLHSTPEAEPFYLRLGFKKHMGLTDGHGHVYFELN